MEFDTRTLENGVVCATLRGRLDMENTMKLENPFAFRLATQKAAVVVDLSGVEFVASIGLRLLLKNAKALANRGGRMVLFGPRALVREVLTMGGIEQAIPVHDDLEAACRDALRV